MKTFLAHALKNWQPSLAAVIVAVAQMGGQVGIPPNIVNWATMIAIVFGLMSAKQQNVTGGTVLQPTPPAILLTKEVEKVEAGVMAPTPETEAAPPSIKTP